MNTCLQLRLEGWGPIQSTDVEKLATQIQIDNTGFPLLCTDLVLCLGRTVNLLSLESIQVFQIFVLFRKSTVIFTFNYLLFQIYFFNIFSIQFSISFKYYFFIIFLTCRYSFFNIFLFFLYSFPTVIFFKFPIHTHTHNPCIWAAHTHSPYIWATHTHTHTATVAHTNTQPLYMGNTHARTHSPC